MINWLIEILEHLLEWLYSLQKPPVEPPEPHYPPFYIEEMRKTHPDKSDRELSETVDLVAFKDTWFNIPQTTEDGAYLRNEKGRLILRKMAGQNIPAGTTVEVYRWAFPVDGGVVRESRWHITDTKGLIDKYLFTKPE